MTQPHTEADLRRNIAVYRQEAERARKWAAIRRQEAVNEDARAALLDGRAAEIEAMLPGLPQRTERTERRHARAARSPA
ncbi:hypothetical protein [uncultured Variovorax sp.]|uniref:hypothetical protein n=1 Tax=uncultured Variovorax sp. TaxID=114708 RepID=UPI002637A64B|nr:hypothetical protein [uncultured Variovorax sp.]